MESTAIVTVTKMIETLPETLQQQVAEHLCEYIATLEDKDRWDAQFESTQNQLIATARRARQEIAEGTAEPMDYDRL